ncbi:MAG: DUF1080 domain-containing protein [Bacteroidales bacterium]
MKFRNLILIFGMLVFVFSCNNTSSNTDESTATDTVKTEAVTETAPNTLSKAETDEGWKLLFDGTTTTGWRGYQKKEFPKGWVIEDGTIKCNGSGRGEAGAKEGGDIVYDKVFSNFDLKLEWKVSKGGNSGIFYLGQEKLDFIWKTAPEMQVLDNVNHPDAKLGKDGNRMAGSLYDLIPAKPQNAKPFDEWNSVEIIVYKGTVVHKMNGETVVEYHLWTPEWDKLVAGSKFPALNKDWAKVASEGLIGLQDHGDDVWYRNIKIKELN